MSEPARCKPARRQAVLACNDSLRDYHNSFESIVGQRTFFKGFHTRAPTLQGSSITLLSFPPDRTTLNFKKVVRFFSAETLVCGQHHQKKGKAALRQPFSINAKASQENCEHQSSYI